MSKHTDVDANNLCITEEVFEKFQAESIYEEEELITLSDLLPSNSTASSSVPDDAKDLLTDENVVLNIQNVNGVIDISSENVQHSEISTGRGAEICVQEELLIEASDLNVSENIEVHTAVLEEKQPKRRGRKKKSGQEIQDTSSGNAHTQHTEELQPKRRGRKKKIDNEPTNNLSLEDQMELIHGGNPDISNSEQIHVEVEENTMPQLPKTRGRKRRLVQEPKINTSIDDNGYSNFSKKDILSKNGQRIPPRQRGRKGKTLQNDNIDVENSKLENNDELVSGFNNEKLVVSEDLPISQTRNEKSSMNEDTNESLDVELTNLTKGRALRNLKKTLTNTNIEKITIASGKKRGRSKKQHKQSFETEFTESQNNIDSSTPSSLTKVEEPSSTVDKEAIPTGETIKSTTENEINIDDDGDEMSLSHLKLLVSEERADIHSSVKEEIITSTIELDLIDTETKMDEILNKRSLKAPGLPEFEYNLDNIANEGVDKENESALTEKNNVDDEESLLVEDTSKRPKRRKIKQNFHYQEDSDEDPFANVELSDDEPRRGKRGAKYSDDEYIPRKNTRGKATSTESSHSSDLDAEDFEDLKKQKRKRFSKKIDSPRKKGKNNEKECSLDVTTVPPASTNNADDIEVCLESSVIKNPQIDECLENKSTWGNTNAFENFIAQKIQGTDLKIKKVSSNASATSLTPLDIPTLDPTAKKLIEKFTQTTKTRVNAQGMQTSPPYDIPMKENVALTKEQSEKACEFLNDIVKTTSELGELMTQKSEDFMKKKIHTNHVTDTFKMDYCVRKSFLLFKLAKHNLMQMEEDLANQYEEFLKANDLSRYREQTKTIASTSTQKVDDSDSDCEIVDVNPVTTAAVTEVKKSEKSKFNPKTVFLNKELSIKITKKPSDDKKLNIKGRHTVWINDSVILKKVKPIQSFLAQDSRNKKPPDNKIIANIVKNFFREYYRQQVMTACAPFISSEWLAVKSKYACHYFVTSPEIPTGSEHFVNNSGSESVTDVNKTICEEKCDSVVNISSPKSLFSLCTLCIQRQSCLKRVASKGKCEKAKKQPRALSEMCLHVLNEDNNILAHNKTVTLSNALPLRTISYRKVAEIFKVTTELNNFNSLSAENKEEEINQIIPKIKSIKNGESKTEKIDTTNGIIKTLFTLCVKIIQDNQKTTFQDVSLNSGSNIQDNKLMTWDDTTDKNESNYNTMKVSYVPQSLKNITYDNIVHLMYNSGYDLKELTLDKCGTIYEIKTLGKICFDVIKANLYGQSVFKPTDVTINSVNMLSEEAFFNIKDTCTVDSSQYQYFDDDTNCYEDEFEPEYEFEEDTNETSHQDNNWVKQVQMKELKSCLVSNNRERERINDNPIEASINAPSEIPFMVNIKSEPIEEELVENMIDPANVKTEPTYMCNELLTALDNVTPKIEPDNSNASRNPIQRSTSYDGEAFEQFVSSNKMIQALDDRSDEIYSQSALRIRRQFDPDWDDENDAGMSLLVPHTYKPLQITEAKDTLMQSSSDESNNKDVSAKKKIDKRKKRSKKIETKSNTNKDINNASKNKTVGNNVVAILTRRMRERIRQEEKKVQSSDSENDTVETRSKSDKKKGTAEVVPDTSLMTKKEYDGTDIQCNNVDSTGQLDLNGDNPSKQKESIPDEVFTGFSTVDQSEISTYQKYLKDVYDKILPKIGGSDKNDNELPINPDDPVEYLECEPTLPIFEKETPKRSTKKKTKEIPDADKDISESHTQKEETIRKAPITESIQIIDRHGWQCYPIDVNDRKLYDNCQILLDKLPETFVEMYFQYQNMTDRSKEDDEVDRLTNLQSLKRPSIKELKSKSKVKDKSGQAAEGSLVAENDLGYSRPESPESDHCNELTPSEDDGSEREEETLVPTAKPASENKMAKSSLMDDNSDTETESNERKLQKVKEEPIDEAANESVSSEPKRRSGPKSKTKLLDQKPAENPDLMLTADKMMNKELTLLHAPIKLDENGPEMTTKKPSTRGKAKNPSKKEIHYRIKNEDDSSSEEEKQWVTTKEKLLKRLEKKQETTLADEAKRTKIVSEYIERRGENPEPRLTHRRRARRSSKRMLERQKQLRVLTRELLGDAADSAHQTKRYNQAYFKGRRNIRKVIDKKSLARSTVVANMEEFERKRRLNMKQVRLREQLGCDEGVNVLVINDELCLEYDFERQQPVVTVHSFFTKIMKAHQYEGVKFMWDACFESLSQLAAGQPGGGCILAHCMGLGKTLQVLALLHTVLTHPGVGMQRVLVCCPLSTVLNWVDEIHKWIGPVTDQIKVFELSKLKKTYERAYQLEDWYSGGGIFIIGYELFRNLTTLDAYLDDVRPTIVKKIRTALLDPGPDIVVCDEGHLLKNDCSVLAVAMSRVVTKRRIMLTGTPMQNNLREYYCMVNFVKPDLLGTYSEYSNRFENPIMNGQHRDSSEEDIKLMKARTHILHKVLEGCLQRQEASVLYPYLPKKHEYTVFISLTKCQWDMYKYYLMHYANKAKHGVLKDFHVLQKVWSHPQVLHHFQTKARDVNTNKVKTEKLEDDLAEEDAAPEADIKPNNTDIWWLQFLEGGAMLDTLESSNKFVVVFRILDECVRLGDKVLIFSTSLFTMDALEFFLRKINKWSLGQDYYRLDGSVPAEVRQKWCREFNAENNHKTKLFLISTRAGSLGLNMTAANRVIILDTSWNPAHDIQSIFRVYRFGQKKDCYIYRLVALGTMEQKIYERSVTKQAVACRVVDEQQIDRHYNMHELTELYRFDESGSGVASGVAAGVRDVALLRVARLRALHAVHEHDSLLRGSEPALPEHERQAAWTQFQQEHETGQLENEEKNVKKISAVKRTYKVAAPATAVQAEEPGADDSPDFKPKEPKAKRGKKSHVEPEGESILPDPDTDRINTLDPDTEQLMVKKITSLLVQHKFSQGALPQLVAGVRRAVLGGRAPRCDLAASIARVLMQKQDNMSTPLVNGIIGESLNQTMPDKERTPALDAPADPPPEPAPLFKATGPSRPKTNKPGPKCRKGYVYEEVPSTSKAPDSLPLFDRLLLPNDNDGRTKRKAALAAEKLLDTVVEDGVIDLDDDDDYSSGVDLTSEAYKTDEMTHKPKDTNKLDFPNTQQTPREPKALKNKAKTPDNELEVLEDVMDTSILLSDDEERVLSKTAVELEPEREISVHPSLLKNNNFIKIVAHTYLAGNPMLDEDAAMLAARYSTYKAVKELESTGKPITSGPIYDIAVQVLGKPILKKLHNTNHKMDTADDAQSSLLLDMLVGSIDNNEQPKTSEDTTKAAKVPERTSKAEKSSKTVEKGVKAPDPDNAKKRPRRRKVYLESDDEDMPKVSVEVPKKDTPTPNCSYLSRVMNDNGVPWRGGETCDVTAAATAQPQGVVPVGLFKTSMSSARPACEESILPDDVREVRDVPAPATAPAPASQITGPTMVPLSKLVAQPDQPVTAQKQPLILKMVRAGNNPQLIASTQQNNTVHIRRTTDDAQQTMPILVPAASRPTQMTNTTICLDSDDEDSNIPQPAPVPVSFTPNTLNPAINNPAITSNPATQQPVKLRLSKIDPSKFILTAKKSQPAETAPTPRVIENADPVVRYIMIPKSQVPQMYPPLVPVSQNQLPPNQVVKSNSDGTFTLHTINAQAGNTGNNSLEKQANPNTYARTTAASTTVGRNQKEVKTTTPVSTPSVSIDTGKILNYTLDKEAIGSKNPMPITPATDERQLTSAKPTTPAKPATPAKSVTPAKLAEQPREVLSSSDSESSESEVNEDPLSILKNVVHIQADSYEERTQSKASKKSKGTSRTKANIATPAKTQIPKEMPSKKAPATAAAPPPNKPSKSRLLIDSVDLTFINDDPSPYTVTKRQVKVTRATPTSNKSAPILIEAQPASKTGQVAGKVAQTTLKPGPTAASKTSSAWQPSVSKVVQPSTSKTQTNLHKSSSSQPVQKKRAAPVETASSKKKKIDHRMTLKDFDIDDIDDIIELD